MHEAVVTENDGGQADAAAYSLRLYVAGRAAKSLAAIDNLRKVCEAHLVGRYELEVIDVLQNPRLAVTDQIVAIPTLLRRRPLPPRRIVGTLSDTRALLLGLELVPGDG
jgi:circadian clock protein KaiB